MDSFNNMINPFASESSFLQLSWTRLLSNGNETLNVSGIVDRNVSVDIVHVIIEERVAIIKKEAFYGIFHIVL